MFTCPICSSKLKEKTFEATCSFCGTVEETDYICPNGHFQCEDCRLATPSEIIERVCLNTKLKNPVDIANLTMKHPSFNQYGVEHHELVAPAVLAALRNIGKMDISDGKIKAAIKRGKKIPYGGCGTMGTYGACVSAGISMAMLTGSNYLKNIERNLTLKTTAYSLLRLTELGSPRCCKFSTYASILSVWEIVQSDLQIDLPILEIKCDFTGKLKECHLEKCPYYGN